MTSKDIKKLRTWVEVDTKALAHNFRLFRKFINPKTKLLAVVKSNAYGHGLVETSQVFAKLGADWLGVDSMTEALALRKAGVKTPILVLGYTRAVHFEEAAKKKITLTVSQFETIKELILWSKKPGKAKIDIHLKVDTGMHRQGFLTGNFEQALDKLAKAKKVVIKGLYSHLAGSGGNSLFREETISQAEEFKKFKTMSTARGLELSCHLTASGGTLGYPEYNFDLVRIGAGLYGLWPSKELEDKLGDQLPLKTALIWKTIISEIKILPEESRVGYDFSERVAAGTKLAICPVGYWHGLSTHLSSKGKILVRNKILPIVGRVSMDMIVIDASSIGDLKVGEEVTLMGGQVGVANMVALTGETLREPITRLNPLIWRVYK